MKKIPIKAENRVLLSEAGKSISMKKHRDRKGYIVSTIEKDLVKVLWDGLKTPTVHHVMSIAKAEPEEYLDWKPVKVNIIPTIDSDAVQKLINYRNSIDKLMIEMNPLNENRGRFMNESREITRLIKQVIKVDFSVLNL